MHAKELIRQSENPNYYEGIWNSIRIEAAEKGIPIHGHFELTPQCNLDCKMCYVHLNKSQMKNIPELKFDEWKKIVDEAIEHGMMFASLSGGECLLHRDFDMLYTYLNSKGILITVLTNGVMLQAKMELFEKYPPSFIQVSVYGYDEISYKQVTGYEHYGKVLNAINIAHEKGLPVGVSVTCSKYLKDIGKIVEYFKNKDISVAVNSWLLPPYDSTGRKLEDFNLSVLENVNISMELYKQNENSYPVPCEKPLPMPGNTCEEICVRGLKCAAGRSDFSINWRGEMSMCVALSEVTGYPLQEGFKNAWEKTQRASKEFQLPGECLSCPYRSVCNHCPAQHLVNAEPGHCDTKICEETMEMVKLGLLKNEFSFVN